MGVVYLATDLRLERKVALKLVAPELAADPRFRERFLRESRLAASLDHSHVVPVYAAGETDGQLWIAMRYVQGTDLKTLLEREGPLEPARALELVSQVGEALDAAHAHGLVHRDVKPANVLVTEEGSEEHCYLADFGLARSPSDEQRCGVRRTSPARSTTPPPSRSPHEPLDQRADVYSLGCVLYECLAGEPPFKRAAPRRHPVRPRQRAATLRCTQRRPELPEAIDPVIARALAKEPGERYETCGELCRRSPRSARARQRHASRAASLSSPARGPRSPSPRPQPSRRSCSTRPRPGPPPHRPPILPVTEDSLVRIDPATGEAVAAIPLREPSPVVVAVGDRRRLAGHDRRQASAPGSTLTRTRSWSRLDSRRSPESPQADRRRRRSGLDRPCERRAEVRPGDSELSAAPRQHRAGEIDHNDIVEDITFAADVAAGHGAVWVTVRRRSCGSTPRRV